MFIYFFSIGLKLVVRLGMVQTGLIWTGTTKPPYFRFTRNFLPISDIVYFWA